jgi:hypothetical protein
LKFAVWREVMHAISMDKLLLNMQNCQKWEMLIIIVLEKSQGKRSLVDPCEDDGTIVLKIHLR